MTKDSLLIFSKNQVSAVIATLCDYAFLLFLVEVIKINYLIGVALASIVGAIVNFNLNRRWTFKSKGKLSIEAVKYAAVSGTSLAWNVGIVALFTEVFGVKYFVSKIIASIVVGVCWNFVLHRYFVFSPKRVFHETV